MPRSTTISTIGQIGERSGEATRMPVRRPWFVRTGQHDDIDENRHMPRRHVAQRSAEPL